MTVPFAAFSFQHFAILGAFGLLTIMLLATGKRMTAHGRYVTALVLAVITFLNLVAEALVLAGTRDYDVTEDLPVYLCDLITIMLPVVIYHRNRKWIGILYFWALAGTLQALITPDVDHGFPSFHFFRYFIMHCGIVMTMVFVVVSWKIAIRWRDWLNAVLFAQVYLIAIHIYNLVMKTNYSYTVRKPDGTSVLDFFGDWPWYLLGGELMMFVLFTLLMIPFMGKRSTDKNRGQQLANPREGDVSF